MYKILKIYDHVMNDTRLSLEEKVLVNHIWSFQIDGKCCFTSNSSLSWFISSYEGHVNDLIFSLKARGIVRIWYPKNSNTRMLSIITGEETGCEIEGDLFEIE